MGLVDQWYENAIIYCLDVETFADANGDDIGDFPGAMRRHDYLSGLGVTYLWLMPYYPTPNDDVAAVVADYNAFDPDSLLNRLTALIRARRECGEIGSGLCRILDTRSDEVLGLRYDDHESAIVVLNNLSPQRCTVSLAFGEQEMETATTLVSDRPYPPLAAQDGRMRINGYGYRWLRCGGVY
jgi:glycosidase